MKIAFLFISVLLCTSGLSAQIGRLPLSPRQTIEQNIGLTDIVISYSRPSKRDREIFGGIVPFDSYWRTGANQNTTIDFSQDVFINNQRVKKGKYALFSKPTKTEWEVILYQDTENWDVPDVVETSKIIARIQVPATQLDHVKEVLLIEIGDFTNYGFDLTIAWDNTSISIPVKLTTKELMDKKIKDHLEGPTYADYYLAAVYQMESGGEFEKGLDWINKAIQQSKEAGWWDLRVKTLLLMKMNKNTEAKKVAEEGLTKAKNDKRESAIAQFSNILIELNQ